MKKLHYSTTASRLRNIILDFYEEFDDFYYRLRYYVMAIEEAEAQLLTNINLPHCEWATEINRSN